MNREEKLKALQGLWKKADNDIKKRARTIYGCNAVRFKDIVNGVTRKPQSSKVSETCITQALQATKQAFKDQLADKTKFANSL
jgi:hypothetical protein